MQLPAAAGQAGEEMMFDLIVEAAVQEVADWTTAEVAGGQYLEVPEVEITHV